MDVASRQTRRPMGRDGRRGGLLGGVGGEQPAAGHAPPGPGLEQRGLEHGRGPVAEPLAQGRDRAQTVGVRERRRPATASRPAGEARNATSSRVKA